MTLLASRMLCGDLVQTCHLCCPFWSCTCNFLCRKQGWGQRKPGGRARGQREAGRSRRCLEGTGGPWSLEAAGGAGRPAPRALTRAALDGPHGGGGARRRGGAQGHALVVLRAALLDGAHVAVAPHAEAAGHRQVQRLHGLRLQLAEHRLAHRLELPVHLHLADLRAHGAVTRGPPAPSRHPAAPRSAGRGRPRGGFSGVRVCGAGANLGDSWISPRTGFVHFSGTVV